MDTTQYSASWSDIFTRGFGFALALVCLSIWLHAADSMLVSTMIPAMVGELGEANLIAWLFALYETGSIVAGVCCGVLANRYGIRTPMASAALLFAVGCAASALAETMEWVLVGRALQGLGGGALIAIAFISVSVLFPRELMPKVMAAMSILWGTSAFFGPLIGGLFVEYGSWRGGFWLFATKATVLSGWIYIQFRDPKFNQHNPSTVTLPKWRLTCLSAGIVLIAWSGMEVSFSRTPILLLLGLVLLYQFLRLDSQKEQNRLLPRNPLSVGHQLGAGFAMILCFTMATYAITTYGPFLITGIYGHSALVAGFVVACASIGWSVAAVPVSGLSEKYDPMMIGIGMIMLFLSTVGFVYSVPNGPIWLIALMGLLEGAGFGICWAFILRRSTALAPSDDLARVSGAITPVQRTGYALGAAYVGLVANGAGIGEADSVDKLRHAATWIFASCLPLGLLGLYCCWRFIRRQNH